MQGRTLLIRPLTAKLTRDTETFGTMDPFVEITIGGKKYKTTTCEDGGKTPTWQDVFTHHLGPEMDFRFTITDEDSVSKSDLIGEAVVPLAETFAKKSTSNWIEVQFKGKSVGTVLINLEILG